MVKIVIRRYIFKIKGLMNYIRFMFNYLMVYFLIKMFNDFM